MSKDKGDKKRRRTKWEKAFLKSFANSGNVSLAAKAAGITRAAAYAHRDKHTDFADEWAEAKDEAMDLLEAEALRRARRGVQEPVYYKGQVVGHVRKYSDTLLIFLLKGGLPEKYAERFRHGGQVGHEVQGEVDHKHTVTEPVIFEFHKAGGLVERVVQVGTEVVEADMEGEEL